MEGTGKSATTEERADDRADDREADRAGDAVQSLPPRAVRLRRRRALRVGLLAVAVVFLLWSVGFYRFAAMIPDRAPPPETVTDAIVVLTGGVGRIGAGLSLLERGAGKKLFVSGVYRGVDVQALLRAVRRSPANVECCITLGYAADSTRGNAEETAAWIRREGHKSLRLVTASYHMPRSLYEFHRLLPPDVVIVPHPVFPASFYPNDWWRWHGSARLAVSEYHKYLIARLVDAIVGAPPTGASR